MSEISLKEYFEKRFDILEKEINNTAKELNRRLEGMNEFREALKDQAGKFMGRDEYMREHQRLVDDIRVLRESKAKLEGKASQTSMFIAMGIALLGLLIAIIDIFIQH